MSLTEKEIKCRSGRGNFLLKSDLISSKVNWNDYKEKREQEEITNYTFFIFWFSMGAFLLDRNVIKIFTDSTLLTDYMVFIQLIFLKRWNYTLVMNNLYMSSFSLETPCVYEMNGVQSQQIILFYLYQS